MKRIILLLCLVSIWYFLPAQLTVFDDFEGNGTIFTWAGDDCDLNTNLANPYPEGINPSATVLEYHDTGGAFANIRFDVSDNFELDSLHTFTLKIYVPSSGLTGNAPNQVSLKLQDGSLPAPWSTQSEIIKPLTLDQWQEISFDFGSDNYVNLDENSPPPTQRSDFNQVLIQINGENNNDQVLAYIDDVSYDGFLPEPIEYGDLIWSDEFDGSGMIDTSKWFQQTQLPNGSSWYNGEIQHYTDEEANAYLENGFLKLTAIKEAYTDQGVTKQHTSARLNSKFAFTYGRVEVRAKLPSGAGTWPAIWLLGKNIDEPGAWFETQGFGTTPWPACGEIDIMEHWGSNPNYVSSAIHTPSSFGSTVNLGGQVIPTVTTNFHVYEMEWTADKIVFRVDGVEHYTYEPEVKDASTWPFDADHYFIFNIAILPSIDPNFTSSAMEIDYIRVYQQGPSTALEEDLAGEPRFFPNPVQDVLTIDMAAPVQPFVQGRVYTISGRQVLSLPGQASGYQLSFSGLNQLPAGMYVLEVAVADQQPPVRLRFVRQ